MKSNKPTAPVAGITAGQGGEMASAKATHKSLRTGESRCGNQRHRWFGWEHYWRCYGGAHKSQRSKVRTSNAKE